MATNTVKKTPLNQIMKHLMGEVDITEAELARRTGIPQPTLHRILSGSTKSPRGDSLSPLANFFSVTISQLIGDDELPKERIPGTYNPSIHGWTSVPVIGWEDAVNWAKLHADMQGNQWDNWTTTDAETSAAAYALLVKGDAMAPRYPEGTTIIIDPAYKPVDRDFVIVRQKGQKQATFKQYFLDGEDVYLRPLNPEFSTIKADKNTKILGVMVQSRTDFVREREPVS